MTTKAKNRLSQSYQSSPCFTFRRLPSVASGKQYYEVHDGVFNWAGSTLAVPDFGPVYGVHLTGPSVWLLDGGGHHLADGFVGESSELPKKLSVVEEVEPEHLGDGKHPLRVRDISENLVLKQPAA